MEESKKLMGRLIERGYPTRLTKKARKRAWFNPRETLLQANDRIESHDQKLICVTTFSTKSNEIKKAVNKHWPMISNDLGCQDLPLHSFKKAKNIHDYVVCSLLGTTPMPSITSLWNLPPILGHFKCGSCKACPSTIQTKEFIFKHHRVKLKSHTNCNTEDPSTPNVADQNLDQIIEEKSLDDNNWRSRPPAPPEQGKKPQNGRKSGPPTPSKQGNKPQGKRRARVKTRHPRSPPSAVDGEEAMKGTSVPPRAVDSENATRDKTIPPIAMNSEEATRDTLDQTIEEKSLDDNNWRSRPSAPPEQGNKPQNGPKSGPPAPSKQGNKPQGKRRARDKTRHPRPISDIIVQKQIKTAEKTSIEQSPAPSATVQKLDQTNEKTFNEEPPLPDIAIQRPYQETEDTSIKQSLPPSAVDGEKGTKDTGPTTNVADQKLDPTIEEKPLEEPPPPDIAIQRPDQETEDTSIKQSLPPSAVDGEKGTKDTVPMTNVADQKLDQTIEEKPLEDSLPPSAVDGEKGTKDTVPTTNVADQKLDQTIEEKPLEESLPPSAVDGEQGTKDTVPTTNVADQKLDQTIAEKPLEEPPPPDITIQRPDQETEDTSIKQSLPPSAVDGEKGTKDTVPTTNVTDQKLDQTIEEKPLEEPPPPDIAIQRPDQDTEDTSIKQSLPPSAVDGEKGTKDTVPTINVADQKLDQTIEEKPLEEPPPPDIAIQRPDQETEDTSIKQSLPPSAVDGEMGTKDTVPTTNVADQKLDQTIEEKPLEEPPPPDIAIQRPDQETEDTSIKQSLPPSAVDGEMGTKDTVPTTNVADQKLDQTFGQKPLEEPPPPDIAIQRPDQETEDISIKQSLPPSAVDGEMGTKDTVPTTNVADQKLDQTIEEKPLEEPPLPDIAIQRPDQETEDTSIKQVIILSLLKCICANLKDIMFGTEVLVLITQRESHHLLILPSRGQIKKLRTHQLNRVCLLVQWMVKRAQRTQYLQQMLLTRSWIGQLRKNHLKSHHLLILPSRGRIKKLRTHQLNRDCLLVQWTVKRAQRTQYLQQMLLTRSRIRQLRKNHLKSRHLLILPSRGRIKKLRTHQLNRVCLLVQWMVKRAQRTQYQQQKLLTRSWIRQLRKNHLKSH
ncbi:uncharacterized protein LOC144752438 [Lissotriton helveticus]